VKRLKPIHGRYKQGLVILGAEEIHTHVAVNTPPYNGAQPVKAVSKSLLLDYRFSSSLDNTSDNFICSAITDVRFPAASISSFTIYGRVAHQFVIYDILAQVIGQAFGSFGCLFFHLHPSCLGLRRSLKP
jgi:hypothetical protein